MFDEKFFDEGGKSSLDGHAQAVADGFVGNRIAPEKGAAASIDASMLGQFPVKAAEARFDVLPAFSDERLAKFDPCSSRVATKKPISALRLPLPSTGSMGFTPY